MALCNRYGMPGSLADAGEILQVSVQKDRRGKALIKKICTPNKAGKRPKLGVDFSQQDLQDFANYCKQDVDSTYQLLKCLPSKELTEKEQQIWQVTQEMNLTGLPIDIEAVERILEYVQEYAHELSLAIPKLTKGMVTKMTEVKRVVNFFAAHYPELGITDLKADTVEARIEADDDGSEPLPPVVRELLELRQMLGRSSTAKYVKMKGMFHAGYVHGNLHYWGTHTGRWAGRGLQIHNLPRAKVKDPEAAIDKFLNFEPVENAIVVAKALIRPMIKAPEGYSLIISDYSSIENRVLAWYANDIEALDMFRTGADQYIDMASFLYKVPIPELTERCEREESQAQAMRQMGKIIILGCGYGMGAGTFQATAKTWGVHISSVESQLAVDAYRQRYKKVATMWYRLLDTVKKAIRNPRYVFDAYRCKIVVLFDHQQRKWLRITLPSGRNLFYMDPILDMSAPYGAVKHWGVHPYSKKWSRLMMTPGRLTENVVQALARDVMADGLLNIKEHMPEVKLMITVHDEGGGLIKDTDIQEDTMDRFNYNLCREQPWHDGLPLGAKGYISKRYKKG
jgi:DNA polymerase